MSFKFYRAILLATALVLVAGRAPASDANSGADATNELRGDMLTSSLLQIQEQLHNTQLALQENQQLAAALARNSSDLMAAHLQSLEQTFNATLLAQKNESDESHKTLEWTLLLTGVMGLAGLGLLLWMATLQSRAFAQLTRISAQQSAVMANLTSVREVAAPARAVVDSSNARLLEAVGELKDRISELEGGGKTVVQIPKSNAITHGTGHGNGSTSSTTNITTNGNGVTNGNGAGKARAELLAEGQKYLDEDEPRQALEILDRYLGAHPDDAEALLKKADALQKVGRNDEALAHYNRVIAADSTLAVAHLQKGGLLNRLRRYDEALNCYEQALQAQEKRRR
jgi:tetratricopeptide (TPR) repeat protein